MIKITIFEKAFLILTQNYHTLDSIIFAFIPVQLSVRKKFIKI